MPPFQREVLSPGRYTLRHVAPQAASPSAPGIYSPPGPGYTVLGQTLYAKALPVGHLPHSGDFSEGQYTLRLGDAGDDQLVFPNRDASDGQPWRARFSTDGHTHFVEIGRENELEFVGCVVKQTSDRQSVTVEGFDGWYLLKEAYEQDFSTVMGPRDFIDRYTGVWTNALSDTFSGNLLDTSKWTPFSTLGGTVSESGGYLQLACNRPGGAEAGIDGTSNFGGGSWRVTATITVPTAPIANTWEIRLGISTLQYIRISAASGYDVVSDYGTVGKPLPSGGIVGTHALTLESDGRWVRGFVDGVLVAYQRAVTAPHPVELFVTNGSGGSISVNCSLVTARQLTPFLMRGSDKGDYVLPGTSTSYPTGGLHGRYYNDLDLQADANRLNKCLNPERTSFAERLDTTWDGTPSVPTGGATTNWSARWSGAIYLKLSQGNYTFNYSSVNTDANTAFRLWVGKADGTLGTALVNVTATGSGSVTLTASTLAGTNPDGSTTVRDGWYPIIVELQNDVFAGGLPQLKFTPPASYTDPGGTALVGGNSVVIPSTSLSPLGCVDQRVQGQSHFDLVQKTGQDFGYQLTLKPHSLESGLFPGVLAPRIREGADWDEIIEPDDIDRKSGFNAYQYILDATDQAASVRAFGSGIANGQGAQVATEVIDVPTLQASLFDLQAWVDAGDIAFPSLLYARAQSELGLRKSSWTNIAGEPIARDRLADTFPLTGTLAQFRWQPGDAVRCWLPDVNLLDQTPRQILQITRKLSPEGRVGTAIGFRQRPKDPTFALREATFKATRVARVFQKQYVTIASEFVTGSVAPGADSAAAHCAVQATDPIIKAVLRVTTNTGNVSFGVKINGTDQTAGLNGPWTGPPQTGVPIEINLGAYAVLSTTDWARLLVVAHNNDGVNPSTFEFQVFVTVLRAQ